jgi:hydrogenase maturation protein HypF
MADRGLRGPVIGVAYDGTGYGSDGAAWGGEVLLADYDGFERFATLRPIRLAGGDAAIRQPWRIALALLDDAFDGRAPVESFPLFAEVAGRDLSVVRQMIATGFRCPDAHGAGRYFDGVGALALGRRDSRFEGQIALEWNGIADPSEQGRYGYDLDRARAPWVVDLRPLVRDVVRDVLAGVRPSIVSARFHNTLVAATADVVRAAARERGRLPVVLTGGCFQNARLAEGLAADLSTDLAVHLHARVPPGDGGLALGQAVIATVQAQRSPLDEPAGAVRGAHHQ